MLHIGMHVPIILFPSVFFFRVFVFRNIVIKLSESNKNTIARCFFFEGAGGYCSVMTILTTHATSAASTVSAGRETRARAWRQDNERHLSAERATAHRG